MIPDGDVDERSIDEVDIDDLKNYSQVHLFAGIGGWPLALQMAGWPEDREVWTGSCPCQPFSVVGNRKGISDERHKWPEMFRLIQGCKPTVIFGEQVASKDGREWLSGVHVDLETLEYEVGAADLCAAGAGAPHIRQRLWWVGNSNSTRLEERKGQPSYHESEFSSAERTGCDAGGMGNSTSTKFKKQRTESDRVSCRSTDTSSTSRVVDSESEQVGISGCSRQRRTTSSFWSDFDIVPCKDGKTRRVESGTSPLAHGVPARVDKIRSYGDAIVPQVAEEFIKAFMDLRP